MDSTDRPLDVHSWLVVVTFMIVIVIVIHPVRIPLAFKSLRQAAAISSPRSSIKAAAEQPIANTASTVAVNDASKAELDINAGKKFKCPYHITLNIATAPVLGVLFLLATKSIDGESIRDGIVGARQSGVEPYAVMILFFSLAYICISLDMTGVLQYAAFWISKRGAASMALYIGNLTNVVACQAYKISFLEYSAWMLLPTFASIAACYVMLRINFRNKRYIPKILKSPDVDPRACLVDPVGAIFGLSVLACSLICLIGTSFAHVSVWIVTGPFAILTLCRDIWYDWHGHFKQSAALIVNESKDAAEAMGGNESRIEQGPPGTVIPKQSFACPVTSLDDHVECGHAQSTDAPDVSASNPILEKLEHAHSTTTAAAAYPSGVAMDTHSRQTFISKFEHRFPLLHAIAIRMPWAILPFTFSMFIMVEGLSDSGWIAIFANWATKLVPNYIAATYAIGFVSVALCNIFNNVPMTILVARILQHPNFVESPLATPEVVKGCLFALVVGSNLGACTTLISSLAGLMWDSILRNKNCGVGFWNFFRWNMGVMPMVIFVALSVVVVELKVIYK
ncbi:hypothetical protein EDD11_004688 [Mortierella claussenii]|nr:hypothetical protein EDD11_004688 [Mortierella claussenii]